LIFGDDDDDDTIDGNEFLGLEDGMHEEGDKGSNDEFQGENEMHQNKLMTAIPDEEKESSDENEVSNIDDNGGVIENSVGAADIDGIALQMDAPPEAVDNPIVTDDSHIDGQNNNNTHDENEINDDNGDDNDNNKDNENENDDFKDAEQTL
jgi:hypothetical protein